MKKGFILITIVLTGSFSAYAQTSSEAGDNFHQIIKQKFMEGGPEFMGIVLLCLILGLALAIERIIYLNMATTNSKKITK